MLAFEWITIVYVAGLLVAGFATGRIRVLAGLVGASTLVGVTVAATLAPIDARLWLPVAYLLAGYRLPGLMVADAPPTVWFETWLARCDARLAPWLPGVPRWLIPFTELAYLFCYPLVPIAFGVAWLSGTRVDVERFWAAVLLSGFLSYASLPWLLSRPPRALTGAGMPARGVPRLNRKVLGRFSHGWNTFPSGHVAVSWAAAVTLWPVSPVASALVGAMAAGISVGAATGSYHYAVDVLAGCAIAAAATVITW
jgi:hypothetical protein